MNPRIPQSDIDALSAWIDGELVGPEADRLADRLANEPALSEALKQMQAVDRALEAWQVPAPAPDLARRIKANVPKQSPHRGIYRLARWAGAVAAAAAVFLAVLLWSPLQPDSDSPGSDLAQDDATVQETPQDVEEFVVVNLDLFQDYDVVVNLETLEEIEKLERAGS
jgi:anti-sigma factor RsiW